MSGIAFSENSLSVTDGSSTILNTYRHWGYLACLGDLVLSVQPQSFLPCFPTTNLGLADQKEEVGGEQILVALLHVA